MINGVINGDYKTMSSEVVFDTCKSYISGVVMRSSVSGTDKLKFYSRFAISMGIRYEMGDFIARVIMDDHKGTRLEINPINCVLNLNNDRDLLFVCAHEVSHLIYGHLLKYYDMFNDDVVGLLCNLATDTEINSYLEELVSFKPVSAFSYNNMYDMLSDSRLRQKQVVYLRNHPGSSTADYLLYAISSFIEKVLGTTIPKIIYDCKLDGSTSFNQEVFKVANGYSSSIFKISKDNYQKAQAFCAELTKYLQQKVFFKISVNNNGINRYSGMSGGGGDGTETVSSSQGNSDNNGDNSIDATPSVCGLSKEEVEDIVKELKDKFDEIKNSGGQAGHQVGIKEKADVVLDESKLPWQQILKQRVSMLSSKYVPSRARINRRLPNRMDLFGRRIDPEFNIVVARDNSGSISDKEYNYFANEFIGIISDINCTLTILEFTSEVDSNITFSNKMPIGSLVGKVKEYLTSGSRWNGGTKFQPIFDWCKDNIPGSKKRSTLVIIFTDGLGEHNTLEYYGFNSRIWVVSSPDGKLSCQDADSNIYPLVKV